MMHQTGCIDHCLLSLHPRAELPQHERYTFFYISLFLFLLSPCRLTVSLQVSRSRASWSTDASFPDGADSRKVPTAHFILVPRSVDPTVTCFSNQFPPKTNVPPLYRLSFPPAPHNPQSPCSHTKSSAPISLSERKQKTPVATMVFGFGGSDSEDEDKKKAKQEARAEALEAKKKAQAARRQRLGKKEGDPDTASEGEEEGKRPGEAPVA